MCHGQANHSKGFSKLFNLKHFWTVLCSNRLTKKQFFSSRPFVYVSVVLLYSALNLLAIGFNKPAYGKGSSGETDLNTAVLDATSKADLNPEEKHQHLIYTLLVAELAATRHLPNITLAHYLEAAQLTQDPDVAQQATQWAIQFQAPQAAILSSEIWAKAAQKDLQAQMVATTLLIGQSIPKALPYLTRAIEINPVEVNQYIVAIQSRLSEKSAENLKNALHLIAKNRPKDPYAHLAAAQTAATVGDMQNANAWVDSALKLNPNFTSALQLKARLIRHEDNSDTRALVYLGERVKQFPQNAELRLFYASALLDARQLDEAQKHLKLLIQDKQYGGQALIYLGEITANQGDFKSAQDLFKKALAYPTDKDNAQYLLGQLAELQGQKQEAITWYSGISRGPYQVTAILKAVSLLKTKKEYTKAIALIHDANPTTLEEQKLLILSEVDVLSSSKQFEDAFSLIDDVLAKLPNDPDLLFSHSLVALEMKQYEVAEKDLRNILNQNKKNTDALNALGYTLSLQKERRAEATQYILQALEIAPNNPAYLDTLGWVYYQLGNLTDAATYLRKATELSSDPDIAAHLGEVLWKMDNRDEAIIVFSKALEKAPEHALLNDTLKRLNIQIKNLKGNPLKGSAQPTAEARSEQKSRSE